MFKKVIDQAILPEYGTKLSSGMDIRSLDYCKIPVGMRAILCTGIALADDIDLGFDWEIQVRPKSGLALNHGITVLNSPGTIDADYKGEIKIILLNTGDDDYCIEEGDKIAQLVVCPIYRIPNENDNERGDGGFGSTGKR